MTKEMTPAQQLAQMQQAAVEYNHASAAAWLTGGTVAERIAAAEAVPLPLPVNGVIVGILAPENRTMYRRPHIRFYYRLNGKRVNEAAALAALAQA